MRVQDVVDIMAKHRGNELAAARAVAKEAQKLWLDADDITDDITIIVISLCHDGAELTSSQPSQTMSVQKSPMPYTSITGDWYRTTTATTTTYISHCECPVM